MTLIQYALSRAITTHSGTYVVGPDWQEYLLTLLDDAGRSTVLRMSMKDLRSLAITLRTYADTQEPELS